jgi:PAS domain S-box-containing protein
MWKEPSLIHLLIADDEVTLCGLIKTALEQESDEYVISTAQSGTQALSRMAEREYDVLVTDIRMPDMDGIQLMHRATEMQRDLQTIVITGHGELDNAVDAMRAGAGNYFRKPIDAEVLHMAVIRAWEKRRLARRLRVSEARFRNAFFHAASGAAILQRHGRFAQVNNGICEMLGHSETELLEMRLADVIHPEDAEAVDRNLRRLIAGEIDHFHMEHRFRHRDGGARWGRASVSIILDCESHADCLVVQVADITLTKRAQMRFRRERDLLHRVMETSPVGIVVVDRRGRLTYSNSYAQTLFALSAEELGERAFDDPRWALTDPEGNPVSAEDLPFRKAMTTGRPVHGVNLSVETGEGRRRRIQVNASPIQDPEGKPDGMVAAIEDVTLRKRVEEELLKVQKLESVATLAGGIAHDFNNLLMIIMGNISLAQDYTDHRGELYQLLVESERACQRATEVTSRFITFSRGGSHVRKVMAVDGVVRDAANLACAGSNIRPRFEFPENPRRVQIDIRQFQQAIINVLNNARDAMPAGGEVEIRVENHLRETGEDHLPLKTGEYVRISVIDSGTGIAEEHLGKIFDPYFSTKAKGPEKGVGMGLATTFSVLKGHGGYVDAVSRPGEGTTVHLYLPAAKKARPVPIPYADIPGAESDSRSRRALVMDDEKTIRTLVRQMLHRLGYEVALTEDGEEAVQAYRDGLRAESPFDLVILDLTVPGGMGGREALSRIRELDENVVAMVSSGYATDPIMADFERHGFSAAMVKPYSLRELREALEGLFPSDGGSDGTDGAAENGEKQPGTPDGE